MNSNSLPSNYLQRSFTFQLNNNYLQQNHHTIHKIHQQLTQISSLLINKSNKVNSPNLFQIYSHHLNILSHPTMQPAPAQSQPSEDGFLNWICYKTWYPFQTLRSVLLLSFILGIIFLAIAVMQIFIYSHSYHLSALYANEGTCISKSNNKNCEVTLHIEEDLQPPILLLYVVQNAYINHRKYINSVSPEQLSGQTISLATAEKECTPYVLNSDLSVNQSYTGQPLDPTFIASPCGFTADLTFNDTYSLYDNSGKRISINESGIELNMNEYSSFKKQESSAQLQWTNPESGHFMTWMKNSALITKYKLWGKIEQSLPAGKYSLVVENNYQIGALKIKKGIEIVVPTSLGGKIVFLPIVYLVMGVMCIAYGIFMRIKLKGYDELIEEMRMKKS